MADGCLMLHVECRVCGHYGSIPQDEIVARFGRVLPVDLKPALCCMGCGARGEVEVRLGWTGAGPGPRAWP
jgi:hypothetical protein